MTHYTVLIRYEGDIADAEKVVGDMLEPYDENKEVGEHKQYLSENSVKGALEFFKKTPKSPSGVSIEQGELTPEEIEEYEGGKNAGKDEKGYYYMSTYNPQSKWDWYEIGGRWSGMLALKPEKLGIYNRRIHSGLPSDPTKIMEWLKKEKGTANKNVDICYLKDLDLEGMLKEDTERITREYYDAVDWLYKELMTGKDINDLTNTLYFEYGIQNESLEEKLARQAVFSTHAVVDDKGWHEASKMGWWAVTYDEKETEQTWAQKFAERFLSNPTDKTVIVVTDCHI